MGNDQNVNDGIAAFRDSLGFVETGAVFIGIIILIVGIVKFVAAISGGNGPRAAKTAVFTVIGVAFLWNLDLVFGLVGLAMTVVTAFFDAIGNVVSSGK